MVHAVEEGGYVDGFRTRTRSTAVLGHEAGKTMGDSQRTHPFVR